MSTAPRGASVQEAYGWYREGKLLVNRRYQRKLVWTLAEKQKLIDSILCGYPLPLFLLAESDNSYYEIIDGMQRLNAIFSFIETSYPLEEKYFDLNEFITARHASEEKLFQPPTEPYQKISKKECSSLLNYQLAITIYSSKEEKRVNEVFSRINASGRQLSSQEKRQAGVVSGFSELVRNISFAIRGDTSDPILKLSDMPVISIETKRESHGYNINAEKTLWCHHGILSTKQLRQSDDEDLIADISASILLGSPLARSKEVLDSIYDTAGGISDKIENRLSQYPPEKLETEIKGLFSLIDDTVRKYNSEPKILKNTVNRKASSIKTPFYVIFMAFYELVIREGKSPANSKKIVEALKDINQRLQIDTRHATEEKRKKNIDSVKGLIQSYFAKKEPSQISHGPGLALDFENSLRRSKIETSRYEFKQGFLQLENPRKFNEKLITRLAQTACGIANIGPKSKGFIHIGVADCKEDADKIQEIDSIEPVKVNGFMVVGVDREAKHLKKTIEGYTELIVSKLKNINISEHLKLSILQNIDIINYRGLSIIRITVEPQKRAGYVNNECFIREGSHTKPVAGPLLEEVFHRFNNR